MKMSKKKTELAVTLLILLACIMLFVGFRISALAFLPTCGILILIGIVYWDKRRAENRYKTKGVKQTVMVLCFTLLLLLTFSTPLVHAAIYQGHAEATWVYPNHHLYVVVDTNADTLNIIWEGCDVLIIPPAVRCPITPWWKAYDDKGYYKDSSWDLPCTGSDSMEYTNGNTWLTVEITWCYAGFILITVPLKVKLYIGSSSPWYCPILSVWNGTDYFEEGLLDIHNPEGEDVIYQHTLVSTPQRENGAYLVRLTEHYQTHSYIDQVNLYAILEDGTNIKLPLIHAWHSEDGNVLPMLLHSDEWKTDTLGADLNNGTSQSIDLKFAARSPNLEVVCFIFQIEGNNIIRKR